MGHELGQTPGDGDGQRNLVSWGLKESELTWRLNKKCKFRSSILFFFVFSSDSTPELFWIELLSGRLCFAKMAALIPSIPHALLSK